MCLSAISPVGCNFLPAEHVVLRIPPVIHLCGCAGGNLVVQPPTTAVQDFLCHQTRVFQASQITCTYS